MTSVNQQILIGVDAMEWDLIRRWTSEGRLPTFQKLIETGYSAELSTTSAQLPDTVWPSIYTGTNPAKFGKYFYCQYDANAGDLKMLTDDDMHCVPFWETLSKAGRRVAVVDAPKIALSTSINGLQLTNWGAHATRTARATNPPEVLAEVKAEFGDHPVADCDKVDDNVKSLRALSQRVLAGVRSHGTLFRWAIQRERWDVFFASFSAPHCIGHHFWHFMDKSHPRHVPGDPDRLGDAIYNVYAAIDEEIGRLLEFVDKDARVMIFGGHGMGAIFHASWNLAEILELLGYGRNQRPTSAPTSERKAQNNFWRVLKMVLPGSLQYAVKNALPASVQHELLFRWYAGARDWSGWKAIALPNNDSVGAIRLQVKGRDKHGIVDAADYTKLCNDIRSALYELKDPVSGRPVVRRVTVRPEEFKGPYEDALPDLMVLWDQRFAWHTLESPRFGKLRIRRQDGRSGSHTPHGFVIAAGSGIKAHQDADIRSIYDIAPSILAGADVTVDPNMDGTPLPYALGCLEAMEKKPA